LTPLFFFNTTKAAEREKLPYEMVAELDKYIIGQTEAKRAVAIALRKCLLISAYLTTTWKFSHENVKGNRWRRRQIPANIREEVTPKNLLMIGPTGVGKVVLHIELQRWRHNITCYTSKDGDSETISKDDKVALH